MIKLLLVVGVAGALTSSADAKIETFGVDRSSDEIGTPGRALHKSGKCCKRAAKLKRNKISYQMHWDDCEKSLEESKSSASDCEKSLEESKAKEMPTCDYASGEVFDGSSCIKGSSTTGGGGSSTTGDGGSSTTGDGGSSTTGDGGSSTTGDGGDEGGELPCCMFDGSPWCPPDRDDQGCFDASQCDYGGIAPGMEDTECDEFMGGDVFVQTRKCCAASNGLDCCLAP